MMFFQQKKRKLETEHFSLKSWFRTIQRQVLVNDKNLSLWIVHLGYCFLLIHTVSYAIKFCIAIYHVDYSYLLTTMPYFLIWMIFPAILFLYSTKFDLYNFYTIKSFCFLTNLVQIWMMCLAKIYVVLSRLFLPNLMKLHTDEVFTKGMVVVLGRLLSQLPLLFLGYFLYKGIFYIYRNQASRKGILAFKITRYITRSDRNIIYPLKIVKTIQTGKIIQVSEEDRYLHTLVDGTTGTGKTSSTILPAIKNDLNMRCKAEDIQKQKIQELLDSKKIELRYSDADHFSIHNFLPIENQSQQDTQELLDYIANKFPVCGITVLAPDDSLTDDVCRLCEGRDIVYNRIDPTKDKDGNKKKNCIGMNPFYLSPDCHQQRQNQKIVKKAIIFSDTLQAITDLKGKADSYFTGLNRQLIANLSILLMVTIPIYEKRQATPEDLQKLVNDFDDIPKYLAVLRKVNLKNRQFEFIIKYIEKDLLGTGRIKMEDQSRGTRNIINEFLLLPENREIFCSQKSIDFDRILDEGEVTVCNFNLASGDTNAIAYGLLFLLSYNNAVLSRPGTEKTRSPHFFFFDELPVLIHPSLEKNFSLFRKFRVAMFVAIQTLDQMEKNEFTKYLKGIILGCAHIIVFGRSSLSDMQNFSALAGVHDKLEEQRSTSETAMSNVEPRLTYSSREAVTQKNTIEEIDIRMRDFQEVTFFTTRNSCPLPVIHGKVNFLLKNDWIIKKRSSFPLDKIFKEAKTKEVILDGRKNIIKLETESISQLIIDELSVEKPMVDKAELSDADGSQSIEGLL